MDGDHPLTPAVAPSEEKLAPTDEQLELELLRQQCEQYKSTCAHLTKKVERLERTVERARKNSPIYRISSFFKPDLGTFFQYRRTPIRIPKFYTENPPLTDPPVISVVTPSFQHAGFLERTMRSVLDQAYPKLEYIVQDGGSADGTSALLERYRPRLKHAESKKDRGQAHAINLGFEHSTGEIMAYLNSDDLLLPGALHYVASYFRAHPEIDVVYGLRVIVDANDQEVGRWVLPEHSDDMLLWADFVPQETLFWRRSIWEKVGAQMDETFQFALDWDLMLRFRKAGASFACLPRFLGGFRMHSLQKTMAIIDIVGFQEMNRLRKRELGFEPTGAQISQKLRGYMWRALIRQRLYELGLIKL